MDNIKNQTIHPVKSRSLNKRAGISLHPVKSSKAGAKQFNRVKAKLFNRVNLIKTHFITADDNLENIIEKYVSPGASGKSDIVVLCQKIVSITQGKIIYRKNVKLGFWAKFLSKFVKKTPYGFSVGNPLKMQVAIDLAGLPRILFACVCAMFGKIFGIKGVFYKTAGHQISQIDGFYGQAFPEYNDMAMLGFSEKFANNLCDKLTAKYNLSFAIADINDIGGNIIGASANIKDKTKLILDLLKSNPAGQSSQQTPIIILRPRASF